ncbi:hypothetical protein BDZ89DRAFT_279740 [Hymenopellis radicata]|nr:hypothetical protein BDZ89DRAFT_279740 [Hymenopellis radicata]
MSTCLDSLLKLFPSSQAAHGILPKHKGNLITFVPCTSFLPSPTMPGTVESNWHIPPHYFPHTVVVVVVRVAWPSPSQMFHPVNPTSTTSVGLLPPRPLAHSRHSDIPEEIYPFSSPRL